jgi:hypothetical protein
MTNTNPNPATRFGAGLQADFEDHGAAVIQRSQRVGKPLSTRARASRSADHRFDS